MDGGLHKDIIREKYNRKASFGIIKEIKPHINGERIGILVQLPFGGVIESGWYRPGYPKNNSTWLSTVFKYSNADSISELPGTLIPICPVTGSDEYKEDMKNDEPPFKIDLSDEKIESEGWTPQISRTGDTSSSLESSNGILEIFSF